MGVGVKQQKQTFNLFSEGLYAIKRLTTANVLSILRRSVWECGSDNSSQLLYFKRVWMRVGV